MVKARAAKVAKAVKEEPLEKQLWKAADKLRKNIDAAEYKHVVLGLMFLKYISDAFEALYDRLKAGERDLTGADPEDKDEYQAENVFFVPTEARWHYLVAQAKQPDIGTYVDAAMDAIEKENPSLKGVLPKVYTRQNLDPTSLGELIDLIGNIALGDAKARSRDVLGHVFEYFLGWLKISDATKTESPFIFEIKEHIKEEGLNKTTLLKKGTLVLSNSATPGIPKILQVDSCIHDGWLHFPKSHFSNEFLYLLFKKIRPELLNQGNGSIFTNLKTDILKEYQIPIPKNEHLNLFQNSVEPLFGKVLSNSKQIRTIETLRDTLLPKLMSGEVRVDYP